VKHEAIGLMNGYDCNITKLKVKMVKKGVALRVFHLFQSVSLF